MEVSTLDNPSTVSPLLNHPADQLVFTNDWFDVVKPVWETLIPQVNPRRVLEIGSYEGASACYLIDQLTREAPLEIHCIDTWEGGVEHAADGSASADMTAVESRFHHNTTLVMGNARNATNLVVHKGYSDLCLARLLTEGHAGYFDFIYVDGSHQAPDVLSDAVLAFKLLRNGGVMVFDDYLWAEPLPYGKDPLRCPKTGIDAFINCYFRKLEILRAPLYQLYVQKISQ